MVYLCPTSQGTSGGFAPGHQNVYLNIIIPDALLPQAHKVLSCSNLENRLFLILNVNPNVFLSLMRGEVRRVEEGFVCSLEIPMRFQRIIFTAWSYSLHWAEKPIRQLQAWLPMAAPSPSSWAWGAHRPTRPCEESIWESKWSFLICTSASSFYFFPKLLSLSLVAIDHPRSHSACSARGSVSQWVLWFLDMMYIDGGRKASFYYFWIKDA